MNSASAKVLLRKTLVRAWWRASPKANDERRGLFLVGCDFDMQLIQLSLRDFAGGALPKTDGAVLGARTGTKCSAEMNSASAKVLPGKTLVRA